MVARRFTAAAALLIVLGHAPTAAAQLANRTADEWINTLETPARLNSLKIAETITKLGVKPGQIVADIGAGTGIFSTRLALAVRPGGTVYAEDVDQALLDHIAEVATEQGIGNVQTVLGEYDDPSLPDNIDLALINDVLHHIEHRAEFLKNLAAYLNPGGRVAVIEFIPAKGGHSDQPELQITKEQGNAMMAAAGLKPLEDIALFDDKWFVIYGK